MKISATQILIKQQRAFIDVQVLWGPKFSNDKIATKYLQGFPSVVHHNCKNKQETPFKDVINSTSIPHLLEHAIIDIQAHKLRGLQAKFNFMGTTEWTNLDDGCAQIQLTFADDIILLSAVKQALQFFNNLPY